MLSTLDYLINGRIGENRRKQLKNVSYLFLINKNRPLRKDTGEPKCCDELRRELNERIEKLGLHEFKKIVDLVLDKLEDVDEALYYFTLVATLMVKDENFETSLKRLSVEQNMMLNYMGEYSYKLYSEPSSFENVPALPWDIKNALNESLTEAPQNEVYVKIPKTIDEWGLISSEYREVLQCHELLNCVYEGKPVDFYVYNRTDFCKVLIGIYKGISCDSIQVDNIGHFYFSSPIKLEGMSLLATKMLLKKHLNLANSLNDYSTELYNIIKKTTDNSLRYTLQVFIEAERAIFWNYLDSSINSELLENDLEEIVAKFDKIELNNDKVNFRIASEQLYTISSGYYNVQNQLLNILKNMTDYSPLRLYDTSYICSRSIYNEYARGMWRRLNLTVMRFIIRKMTEMLTSGDSEILELLIAVDDAKQVIEPSIWQRLNPLVLEKSKFINPEVANKFVDLVIGYRFFVNDNNKDCEHYYSNRFIKDSIDMELFPSTPDFDSLIDSLMSEIDMDDYEKGDELSESIEKLLCSLPTSAIVDKYSQVVLDDSIQFFKFLKYFFTAVHDISFMSLCMADEDYKKIGCDWKFLKHLNYNLKSPSGKRMIEIKPPVPLNVYVSDGVQHVYSNVYSILDLLQVALDAIIKTRHCETLMLEPSLRYCFHHMNSTVFEIRKNMLSLIDVAYEKLEQSLDVKSAKVDKNALEWLNTCYKVHRRFVKEVASAVMMNINKGSTYPIVAMMVEKACLSSEACVNHDAVSSHNYYLQFLEKLSLFIDQCKHDKANYDMYRCLEGEDEADGGKRSKCSSFSDDLSCRTY